MSLQACLHPYHPASLAAQLSSKGFNWWGETRGRRRAKLGKMHSQRLPLRQPSFPDLIHQKENDYRSGFDRRNSKCVCVILPVKTALRDSVSMAPFRRGARVNQALRLSDDKTCPFFKYKYIILYFTIPIYISHIHRVKIKS